MQKKFLGKSKKSSDNKKNLTEKLKKFLAKIKNSRKNRKNF